MLAHVGKMTVLYKRGRVEHSARQMVLPLIVGDVLDGIPIDVSPNTNQAAPTVYNRTAARPSSPEHPITSCRVCGAPNDLGQKGRSVAAPKKAPPASSQPVTTRTVGPKTDAPRFRRVSSTNEYTAPHNTHAESLESRKQAR